MTENKQERMQYYYKYYLNITIQQFFKKTTLKEKSVNPKDAQKTQANVLYIKYVHCAISYFFLFPKLPWTL